MSLTANPQFTPDPGGVGGLYGGATGTTLAGGASVTQAFGVGAGSKTTSGYATACLSCRLQAALFAGATVAATNGLQVQVYSCSDGGPTQYDTVSYATFPQLGAVASSTTADSIDLPPGLYKAVLTNLDATNSIKVALTLGTTG